MNIYRIWQTDNNNYDTYDSAVVIAETEEEARNTHPDGNTYKHACSFRGCWVDPSAVKVDLIGKVTNDEYGPGVVCCSFNAG